MSTKISTLLLTVALVAAPHAVSAQPIARLIQQGNAAALAEKYSSAEAKQRNAIKFDSLNAKLYSKLGNTPVNQPQGVQTITTEPNLMAESDWRQFSSSPGNFSVSFPGKPTEEKSKNAYTMTVEGDEGLYLLSYTDLPQAGKLNSGEISKILEFAPRALMSEIDAKLLSSKSISLNGYPGQEFEFTYKNFLGGTGRIYVVGERLYMMMAVTNQQENSQKFFKSFQLLNNPSLAPLGAG